MTATIFDIKHYAIHDGSGIRQTIFFKGCPLSCWWYHNPEGRSPEIVELKKKEKIGGNQLCVTEIIGKKYSIDNVIAEIQKDIVFFEESGGGITLSEGEPLLQYDFAKGSKGVSPRIITGALIVKHKLNLTDAETIEIISENAHIQFFLGFTQFNPEPIFSPSLFVDIRKCLGKETFKKLNELLIKSTHPPKDKPVTHICNPQRRVENLYVLANIIDNLRHS